MKKQLFLIFKSSFEPNLCGGESHFHVAVILVYYKAMNSSRKMISLFGLLWATFDFVAHPAVPT